MNKELAQAIVNYLITKPYQEVVVLIDELQKAYSVKPKGDKPTEEKTQEKKPNENNV